MIRTTFSALQSVQQNFGGSSTIGNLFSLSTFTRLLNTSRHGDSTTSLGRLFQCLTTLSVRKFFQKSNLNFPWCNWCHFLASYHLSSEKRGQHPPCSKLLSGSCGEQRGVPSACCSPDCTAPGPSSVVFLSLHQLCCSSLSTFQQLGTCILIRGPKTEHSALWLCIALFFHKRSARKQHWRAEAEGKSLLHWVMKQREAENRARPNTGHDVQVPVTCGAA